MKILNFELEEKLDLHSKVKFDGKSDGTSLKAQNPYFDLLIGHNRPIIGQKMKIFNFELEEKLGLHF